MSRDAAYLADMLDSARLIREYATGNDLSEFDQNTLLQDAILRRFEILGEAARRVTDQTKLRFPHIPWAQMISMRNLVTHQYDAVDSEIVWSTIDNDLPPLIIQLEDITEGDSELTAD